MEEKNREEFDLLIRRRYLRRRLFYFTGHLFHFARSLSFFSFHPLFFSIHEKLSKEYPYERESSFLLKSIHNRCIQFMKNSQDLVLSGISICKGKLNFVSTRTRGDKATLETLDVCL